MSLPADPHNADMAYCDTCGQTISNSRVAAHLVSKKHKDALAAHAKQIEDAIAPSEAKKQKPAPAAKEDDAGAAAAVHVVPDKKPKAASKKPKAADGAPGGPVPVPTPTPAPAKKAKAAAKAAVAAPNDIAAESKKPKAPAPANDATAAAPKKVKASAKDAKAKPPIELPADPSNPNNVWCAICKQSVARARGPAHLATDKHAAAAAKYLQTTMTTAPTAIAKPFKASDMAVE